MIISDFSNYPLEKRELTNTDQNTKVLELAQQIVSTNPNIVEVEDQLFRDSKFISKTNPVLLEAIKCAAAKKKLKTAPIPIHLTVVFAMYQEASRLLPKSSNNPHGEDCLREKIRQLDWLTHGIEERFSWNIIAVDDGCVEKPSSYDVAQEILANELHTNISVIKLEDYLHHLAICPGFIDLETTEDSRKGGAITCGLWKAQNTFVPNGTKHIIAFTDADLSSNLAQFGSLIFPIITNKKKAAIGHRYGTEKSVLIKGNKATTEPDSTISQPGKLIILLRHYARKALLPQLEHIKDTQAGFKAFDAKALSEVLPYLESMNETFDVELLLRFISKHGKSEVESVPFLFTEDLAMSNFPANSVSEGHIKMFDQLISIYEKFGNRFHLVPQSTYKFWKDLSITQLMAIIQHLEANPPKDLDKLLFDFNWDEVKLHSLGSNQLH